MNSLSFIEGVCFLDGYSGVYRKKITEGAVSYYNEKLDAGFFYNNKGEYKGWNFYYNGSILKTRDWGDNIKAPNEGENYYGQIIYNI